MILNVLEPATDREPAEPEVDTPCLENILHFIKRFQFAGAVEKKLDTCLIKLSTKKEGCLSWKERRSGGAGELEGASAAADQRSPDPSELTRLKL